MKISGGLSRREFLKSGSALAGTSLFKLGGATLAAIAQAACTARDEGAPFTTLGTDEARDFEAVIDRLIPATDTPGAAEAGVIRFWDNVLGNYYSHWLVHARQLRQRLADRTDSRFATLSPADQDTALRSLEHTHEFEVCRMLTLFGFFGMSRHGGNKDHLSWDLVGYQGHHGAWAPPFGHYDAEYMKEQADDE